MRGAEGDGGVLRVLKGGKRGQWRGREAAAGEWG